MKYGEVDARPVDTPLLVVVVVVGTCWRAATEVRRRAAGSGNGTRAGHKPSPTPVHVSAQLLRSPVRVVHEHGATLG